MRLFPIRPALIALVAGLAACSTPAPPSPPPAPAPVAPPVALDRTVAEAASVYVAFARSMTEATPVFDSPESVQAFLSRGAAYEPVQLSRGLIAYAAIIALQTPDYVSGVRALAADPAQRSRLADEIQRDPSYAAVLPGAEAAASRIASVLSPDINAFSLLAETIESDAYVIQERSDPRRRWAAQPVADRAGRLERAKAVSAAGLPTSDEDALRLFASAHALAEPAEGEASYPAPYSPAVTRALAVAALAALGDGPTDPGQVGLLTQDQGGDFCLSMSKLNLFQCLAASRPSYEDMFCIGRHVVRDLETCIRTSFAPDTAP